MSRSLEAYAVAGFLASALAHFLTLGQVPIPTEVLLGITIALFPVFILAILIHPARHTDLTGTYVFWDDVKNIPVWLHVLVWASLAYDIVLWLQIPMRHFSLTTNMTYGQRMIASWTPAVFYAASFCLLLSARKRFGP